VGDGIGEDVAQVVMRRHRLMIIRPAGGAFHFVPKELKRLLAKLIG
jgi:hypothetical protein